MGFIKNHSIHDSDLYQLFFIIMWDVVRFVEESSKKKTSARLLIPFENE